MSEAEGVAVEDSLPRWFILTAVFLLAVESSLILVAWGGNRADPPATIKVELPIPRTAPGFSLL
jgi:hypothetical protein